MSELFNERTIIPGKEVEAAEIERHFNNDAAMLHSRGYSRQRALDTAFRMNFILLRRVLDFDVLEKIRLAKPIPKEPYRNPNKQKTRG